MSLWRAGKPTICAIHGAAVAGGSDIALCCDMILMAEDARIGYPPARVWGIPTTMMWVYRLGLEHAKQFLLTGRAIDADTAHRIGLVSQVCAPEEISAVVEAEARRFRHIPANQLALNKMLINQAVETMGLRTSQLLGTIFDGVARHTQEGLETRVVPDRIEGDVEIEIKAQEIRVIAAPSRSYQFLEHVERCLRLPRGSERARII